MRAVRSRRPHRVTGVLAISSSRRRRRVSRAVVKPTRPQLILFEGVLIVDELGIRDTSALALASDTAEDLERKAIQMREVLGSRGAPAGFIEEGIEIFTEMAFEMREDGYRTFGEWIAHVETLHD